MTSLETNRVQIQIVIKHTGIDQFAHVRSRSPVASVIHSYDRPHSVSDPVDGSGITLVISLNTVHRHTTVPTQTVAWVTQQLAKQAYVSGVYRASACGRATSHLHAFTI